MRLDGRESSILMHFSKYRFIDSFFTQPVSALRSPRAEFARRRDRCYSAKQAVACH
jgi:hypothetical protein